MIANLCTHHYNQDVKQRLQYSRDSRYAARADVVSYGEMSGHQSCKFTVFLFLRFHRMISVVHI